MKREKLQIWLVSSLIVGLVIFCTALAWADTIHDNETINSNTTWTAAGNDHIIIGSVQVNSGVTLTIEDGCIVKFDNTAYITVSGTLNATGTSNILFTRRDPTDEWQGLMFYSGSSGTLQHCTIEYATYSTGYGIYAYSAFPTIEHCTIQNNDYGIFATGATSPTLDTANTIQSNNTAGVRFYNCTNPSISNQTMTGHTSTYGAIYMDRTGEFTIGSGNSITGNSWGLTMDIGSYPSAASAGNIPTAGNTNDDGIQVYGGSTNGSVIWRDVAADYIVTSTPGISSSDILAIEDNVNVRFEHTQYITVSGTLNATGISSILFTRRDPTDEWQGLMFYSGSSGTLQHCTIEYATYSTGYGIYAVSPAALNLSDCILRNNDYGLWMDGASSTTAIRNSIITANNYGIYCTNGADPIVGGSPIDQNDIAGNSQYAFYSTSPTVMINARYNWWGHVTGPYDPSPDVPLYNPDGEGDSVSDYVDYSFWATSPLDTTHSEGCDAWVSLWGDGLTSPGCHTSYSIVYGNRGDVVTESVTIVDTLPLGTTYLKDLSGITPVITGSGQVGDPYVICWAIGSMPPDSRFYFQIMDSVHSDVAVGDSLSKIVTIATTGEDPQYLNDNQSSWHTQVVEADTDLVMCIYGDAPRTGFDTPVYFHVGDVGTVPAEDIVLVAYLDSLAEYVSSSGNSVYDPDSHMVTWDIGMIQPPSGKCGVGPYRQIIWETGQMVHRFATTPPCTPVELQVKCFRRSGSAQRYLDQSGARDDHVRGSRDPNDKQVTPQGYGTGHGYIWGDELFHYVIHFENVESATAAATYVTLIDQLDPDLDWTTLQIGLVGVDTVLYTLETYDREDLTFNFDPNTGIMTFYFENIDLPPNVTPPEGEGFVLFSVAHKCDLPSGTEIRNNATIVFDYNPPMDTPETINTIDRTMPESAVDSLPAYIDTTTFLITWTGMDSHSGIKHYTIYVSQDDDTAIAWLTNTTDTSAFFTGEFNHTYSFYSIATDNVGNVEDPPSSPDAGITILGVEQDSSFLPNVYDLSQNYPNPFNQTTVIRYQLSGGRGQLSPVSLKVYNILGQEVVSLVDGKQKAGHKTVSWDATSLSSGIYFYRLQAGDFVQTRKMVLLK